MKSSKRIATTAVGSRLSVKTDYSDRGLCNRIPCAGKDGVDSLTTSDVACAEAVLLLRIPPAESTPHPRGALRSGTGTAALCRAQSNPLLARNQRFIKAEVKELFLLSIRTQRIFHSPSIFDFEMTPPSETTDLNRRQVGLPSLILWTDLFPAVIF